TAMSINGAAICLISIYSMTRVINLKITLIALLPIPVIVFYMLKIGSLIQKRFRKVQECFAAISDRVQENIYGIRVIKAYVQEYSEMENFQELNNDMMDANIKMVRISSFLSPLIEASFSISFVINLILGGNMVLNGVISLGSFIAFNGYLVMIMNPIKSIGRILTIFQRGIASLKRLNVIFSEKNNISEGNLILDNRIQGSVEFKNLSFSYIKGYPALNNINLKIPAGSTLGIIGETGSGKSTLTSLLLKLYNVNDGMIFIDGHDINEFSLYSLRGTFGYVPQDSLLFSATVYENIKFFKTCYTDDQAEGAAKLSSIYDSILHLPNGFDSLLGERGVNLSGGQKQRIAIARALIKDPPILILDDSLSAVDTITEDIILNNLKKARKNKTSIVIAHRISAVENLDNIIVMRKGNIIEAGNHSELMAKGGLYYEIYMEQYKERKKGLLSS
ncbi:MAG: ABC transporter ATP-binding protein/permease, partial [Bacillota bacterium]|nr:ABC transporter ATP-binding protein/permease [Bacillota bacterium]